MIHILIYNTQLDIKNHLLHERRNLLTKIRHSIHDLVLEEYVETSW